MSTRSLSWHAERYCHATATLIKRGVHMLSSSDHVDVESIMR